MQPSSRITELFELSVFVDTPQGTTAHLLSAYFDICGAIQHIVQENAQAIIVFESATAAQTALLLDSGQLGSGPVHVRPLDTQKDMVLIKRLLAREPHEASGDDAVLDAVLDVEKSIFVSRLAPACDAAALREFLAFAGTVQRVQLWSDPSNPPFLVAGVEFDHAAALDTALLLDSAHVLGHPIGVTKLYGPLSMIHGATLIHDDREPTTLQKGSATDSISQRLHSVRNAGHTLGQHALTKAKALDEGMGVSSTAAAIGGAASTAASAGAKAAKEGLSSAFKSVKSWRNKF